MNASKNRRKRNNAAYLLKDDRDFGADLTVVEGLSR
jgi:hypothetical protein